LHHFTQHDWHASQNKPSLLEPNSDWPERSDLLEEDAWKIYLNLD